MRIGNTGSFPGLGGLAGMNPGGQTGSAGQTGSVGMPGASGDTGATNFADAVQQAMGGANDILSGNADPGAAEPGADGAVTGADPAFGLDSASMGGSGIGDTALQAIKNVNDVQAHADELAQKLATGDVQDIHQVMLALNQASMAFDLTVQVRNKVVEAYQEVMRMQV